MTGSTIDVTGCRFPFELAEGENTLKLQIFLDRSVLEVFVNDGMKAVTQIIYPDEGDLGVEVFSQGDRVRLSSLDTWKMKSIWPNRDNL